jgi:hypothetical protein
VQNHKVPRAEAFNRVSFIMSGEVRDKGCPKEYCLKRPTIEVSVLLAELFLIHSESFLLHSESFDL